MYNSVYTKIEPHIINASLKNMKDTNQFLPVCAKLHIL